MLQRQQQKLTRNHPKQICQMSFCQIVKRSWHAKGSQQPPIVKREKVMTQRRYLLLQSINYEKNVICKIGSLLIWFDVFRTAPYFSLERHSIVGSSQQEIPYKFHRRLLRPLFLIYLLIESFFHVNRRYVAHSIWPSQNLETHPQNAVVFFDWFTNRTNHWCLK